MRRYFTRVVIQLYPRALSQGEAVPNLPSASGCPPKVARRVRFLTACAPAERASGPRSRSKGATLRAGRYGPAPVSPCRLEVLRNNAWIMVNAGDRRRFPCATPRGPQAQRALKPRRGRAGLPAPVSAKEPPFRSYEDRDPRADGFRVRRSPSSAAGGEQQARWTPDRRRAEPRRKSSRCREIRGRDCARSGSHAADSDAPPMACNFFCACFSSSFTMLAFGGTPERCARFPNSVGLLDDPIHTLTTRDSSLRKV